MKMLTPASLVLALGLGLSAADMPNHTLVDLPEAVKAAILRQAGSNTIGAIEIGLFGDRDVYFVRIEQPGIDKRVTIATDGSVLKVSDYEEVNRAIVAGKDAGRGAWDKTKEVAGDTWSATKETVRKAAKAFSSDELTLNQVPERPRATLEREAAGNRLTDIHAESVREDVLYRATIRQPDGAKRAIAVHEDGTLAPAP
jgi:hypothetical protein